MIEIIEKYFPTLSERQKEQYTALGTLYPEWNAKINVISRKDIDNLYEHHILHSLGIAKAIQFTDNTTLVDVGTGGGFPGIPLAIMFPNCHFHLIDRIGKKVRVATEIANAIGTQTDHGLTILDGHGWYTGKERKVICLLAKKRESVFIFRLIKTIDPNAFVSQSSVIGVYGEGFDEIKVKTAKRIKD